MEKIVTAEQFVDFTGQEGLTVVKYTASWCPDCRNLDRFIGDVAADYPQAKWAELDVDQLPDIAEENEVRGIPSLLVYQKGQKIGHLHSKFAKTPEQVREYLQSVIK